MGTWIVRLAPGGDGPRLAVKDCIDVAGIPTTAGCPVVAEMAEPAANDATVVASAREAGARIVGKTSLTELCWSASGVNHWSGTPVNPKDPRRLPGGSSSGSAVAVATGEADVSFGTDTGGSIRIPAACCGVVGLKTTFGRVSTKGVYPLAPSLDTVGPMGPDVAAAELGMRLIEPGFTVPPLPDPTAGRITVTGVEGGVDPVVDTAVDRALAAAGIAVTEVACLDFRTAIDAFRVIVDAEGFRTNAYLMPYLHQLSPHVRRNLERGARLTRADRAAAERIREQVRATFGSLLADFPVLVLPTLTGQPPLLGERAFALTTLTAPASLAGLAALALPVPADGGAIASLQVIGANEETVLAFGRAIEAAATG
ncbi:MAG TPA: amidase [Trebonia sp.]|jgi:amidase|nr:amidase [Trebonia sp.]